MLKVIKNSHRVINKRTYVDCICFCGNKKTVRLDHVRSRSTKSCGCLQKKIAKRIGKSNIGKTSKRIRKDLTGKRFGRLLVIKFDKWVERRYTNVGMWLCLCDCGKECSVSTARLNHKRGTKSCGCLLKDHVKKKLKYKGKAVGYAALNGYFTSYRNRAYKKNIVFELTKEYFGELVSRNCMYCGSQPFNMVPKKVKNNINGRIIVNGIDRIDSSIGYTVDNCVPCCKICNVMKNSLTKREFLEWVEKIYKYSLKKTLLVNIGK